ncbi:MAG: ribosomal protein S18-alanine N-acetyltransferase [Acholeplasmatales bacterium]|nr:ribosomal protein S18-alanine N-acetyltransferase [Acholeplasmatales bacterium]
MIRYFNASDVKRIIELEKKLLGTTLGESYFEMACGNEFNYIYVYEKQGEVVGYISFTFDGEIAEMLNFCVDEKEQGKGIGKKLYLHAEEEFKNKNASSVILEVNRTNHNAINVYTKIGFKEISIRKGYYSDGNDALVLQKLL